MNHLTDPDILGPYCISNEHGPILLRQNVRIQELSDFDFNYIVLGRSLCILIFRVGWQIHSSYL